MAKLTVRRAPPAPPPPKTYTLELDQDELDLIAQLSANMGGDGPHRAVNRRIYHAVDEHRSGKFSMKAYEVSLEV